MLLKNAVQLICYPDRIGKDLKDLHTVVDKHLSEAIGGLHILPFFPSNADGGFSPSRRRLCPAVYQSSKNR